MDTAALLDTSPHAVLVLDSRGGVTYVNASAVILLGVVAPGITPGPDLLAMVHPRHHDRAIRLWDKTLAGASVGPVRLQLDGPARRWVSVRTAPIEGGGAQVAVVEVTEQAHADERLRHSEQRFRAAFDASPMGMALVDGSGAFLRVNPSLADMMGRPVEWFPGHTADDITDPDDQHINDEVQRRLDDRRSEDRTHPVRAAKRYRRPDGTIRYGVVTAVSVDGDDGLVLRLAQIEDVTDRRQAEERLQRLALHDALTDLPGRSLLLDRVEEALEDTDPVAVLFVDIDGFKLINDALGHAAGDAVLVEVGRRLSDNARGDDVVGRLGGDEFLVLCRHLADPREALEVAHRMERAVARPIPYGRDEILVSISVGVAFSTTSGTSPTDLVRDADAAMYRAKQLGKKRFEVFDEAMRERASRRARIERLLRDIRVPGRVLIHYQPVADLPTGRVVAVEALARLVDDSGQVLLPAEFLDVAVESGTLAELDDIVLDRAVHDVTALNRQLGTDLAVAVNLSAARITPDLPRRVADVLARTGLSPDRLVLEITEQTLVDRGPAAETALRELHDCGVTLSLDDFGTGWASLTYLRRFPVTIVKIDKSFVEGMMHQLDDHAIVESVAHLAGQMGLLCTAEGVETQAQADALQGMGVHHGQGWHYGRPVALADLPALLSRRPVRR